MFEALGLAPERLDLVVVRFLVCAKLVTGNTITVAINVAKKKAMIRGTLFLLSLTFAGRLSRTL